MAHMIPDVESSELEHVSEAPVYEALRSLPDGYTVLHSYPWLRPWRGEGAWLEGEADFVVLHPDLGMLVLEVKGGDTIRHDGTRWFRDTNRGPVEFQDPFRQARRSMYALLEIAKERSGGRIRRLDFVHGYAVVLPHMDYEGQPPPHADQAIVISRRNLPFIEQALDTAYRGWQDSPKKLSSDRYRMLLNDCLMPSFRVFKPVGADIGVATQQLLELTEHQAQVFRGLYVQDRVLVEGVAGSGKTFLALERALSFARAGKRTLFACYNKELAAWLRHQVEEDPATAEFRDLLTIENFHALAAKLAADAGIAFEPTGGRQRDTTFWDYEVPDLLEQAVGDLEQRSIVVRFDALVVDEAQDFATGWWYALTDSLLTALDAPLYVFADPHQCLRGVPEPTPVDFQARFQLTVNCRNTRKIATASAAVLELESQCFTKAPVGVAPRILRAGSQRHQKGLVLEELRRLLDREQLSPDQIVLIGPAAKANGSLADVEEVNGTALVTNSGDWRDGGGVLVTTAKAFKGLEADVVILYDVGEFGRLFRKEDLYVACTRPRALLIAVVHGEGTRKMVENAFAAAGLQT